MKRMEVVFCISTLMHVFSVVTFNISQRENRTVILGVLVPHSGSRAFGYETEATMEMAVEKVSFYSA